MCFFTDEYAQVWKRTVRKARKEHRCEECPRRIPRGEQYHHVSGIFDGDPFELKWCENCEAVRRRIHDIEIARGCREYEAWCPVGELREAISDGDYGLLRYDGETDSYTCDPVVAHLFPHAETPA